MKHLPLLILITFYLPLAAQVKVLRKFSEYQYPKRHPYTELLKQEKTAPGNLQERSFIDNNLLVILVDFQEDDNPLSTGNGKFQLEPDPDYLYSIGSPPHNHEYYLSNLEALRYYYLAASAGTFNLQYDLYPKTQQAYTLPHDMAYYNPPGASGELFVARMEEYFKAAIELADQTDPEIDFRQYSHFMIIHAGSDWQHDVLGDSPVDIPSFFIRVGEDKAAVVDEGSWTVTQACNVPATISQDFRSRDYGDAIYWSGYGALNAVIAHEFGHSMGLVDLYNTRTFQPMVGVFDIMDSGGSGVLVDGPLTDGSYVMVEGILPALPGAFSRALLFEEDFRANGMMKDAYDLAGNPIVNIAASSVRQDPGNIRPSIVKLPLSETEYVLVENRSVDPDGDGATAVFGDLNGRVILYPTAIDDPNNNPTYEYDYLLPSFLNQNGASIGGGVMLWHVNEDIIYNQGTTYSDGQWVSNFDNNTVNTAYNYRGVKVIEADGLEDIGNEYSYYWTGTQYEYFHQRKPNLNEDGSFAGWSSQEWRPRINSITTPALLDTKNLPSLYWLDEISNPATFMSLKIKDSFFSKEQIVVADSLPVFTAPMILSSFTLTDEIPLFGGGRFELLSRNQETGLWENQLGYFPVIESFRKNPVIVANQSPDQYMELVLSGGSQIDILDFLDDFYQQHPITFPDSLTSIPIYIRHRNPDGYKLYVATQSSLFRIGDYVVEEYNNELGGILRMAETQNGILALRERAVLFIDRELHLSKSINLPESFGLYEPVIFNNQQDGSIIYFLMANTGSIYRLSEDILTKIYTAPHGSANTQMGLSRLEPYSPGLFFASGDKAFALREDGSLIPGFPVNIGSSPASKAAHLYSIKLANKFFMFFPLEGRGYIAIDERGNIDKAYSMIWESLARADYWHYSHDEQELVFYHIGHNGKLHIKTLSGISQDPILWNGFRNGETGNYDGMIFQQNPPIADYNAWIYPNPVSGDIFRLRLENQTQTGIYSIYDISGNLIQRQTIAANGNLTRDLEIDSSRLSSGVYILTATNGNQIKRLKFAIQK